MKKIIITILTLVLSLSIISGCTNGQLNPQNNENQGSEITTPTNEPNGKTTPSQGIAYNEISFEVIEDITTLPQELQKNLESYKTLRGYTWNKDENSYIISIFSGEKMTGGYSIEVKSVEDIEGITKITV